MHRTKHNCKESKIPLENLEFMVQSLQMAQLSKLQELGPMINSMEKKVKSRSTIGTIISTAKANSRKMSHPQEVRLSKMATIEITGGVSLEKILINLTSSADSRLYSFIEHYNLLGLFSNRINQAQV